MPEHFDREQWEPRAAQERNLNSFNVWETRGKLFVLYRFLEISNELHRLVNDMRIPKNNETYS